jgi:hypothetical protein
MPAPAQAGDGPHPVGHAEERGRGYRPRQAAAT